MASVGRETLPVESLGSHHDRSSFDSGVEPLDKYFKTQAGQDARKNMAAPFVLIPSDGRIAGSYTLSSTAVRLAELPPDVVKKPPRYPLAPATLLGRLAVDQRQRGKSYGRFLLADALWRSARSEIASFALVAEAKDDDARRFCQRECYLGPNTIQISTRRALHQRQERRFGVNVHGHRIARWLHELGLTRLQPRPVHPKKDPEAESAFKKTSPVWSKPRSLVERPSPAR